MSQITSVVIVGAGPCGLLAGLLLARAGVRCTIFEKNTGLSTHPKAMGISRRTCEIYRQIGIYPALAAVSLPLEERSLAVWSRTLAGEELGRTPLREFHSPLTPVTAQHCPQTETERILLDALRLEPLASIQFGAEVLAVRMEESGGEVRLADGTACVFSWLVVADGAGSRLRKQFGVGTTGPGDMGHFLNLMLRAPYGDYLENRPALLYNCFWEGGFDTFVSINGHDRWLMHHFLEPGEVPTDFSASRLLELVRQASGLPEVPVEIEGVSPWVMSPKLATSFRHGRALFVGDAAARLSPAGGLGLNTGLQSVHNLAWKLAAVVQGQAAEKLLDTYHSERHAHSAGILRATNQNAGEIFATVAEALAGHWEEVRSLIAKNRRGGSNLGLDLGVHYESGAFVPDGTPSLPLADPVNDYLPSARPGGRAPHLPIETSGHETSLLDFFRGSFTLLSSAKGQGWPDSFPMGWTRRDGRDFHAEGFSETYGVEADGAVLVRPDGIVAARWASAPADPALAVTQTLQTILH